MFDSLWGRIEQHAVDKSPDAAAHNPKFAKEAGVPVKVAKEFVAADKRAGKFISKKGK